MKIFLRGKIWYVKKIWKKNCMKTKKLLAKFLVAILQNIILWVNIFFGKNLFWVKTYFFGKILWQFFFANFFGNFLWQLLFLNVTVTAGICSKRSQEPTFKIWSTSGKWQLGYCQYGQMSPGQMLHGQMSIWQLS